MKSADPLTHDEERGPLLENRAISDQAKREAKETLEAAGMATLHNARATEPGLGKSGGEQWTRARKIDSSPPPELATDPLEKAAESLRDVPPHLPVPVTHQEDAKAQLIAAGFDVLQTNPGSKTAAVLPVTSDAPTAGPALSTTPDARKKPSAASARVTDPSSRRRKQRSRRMGAAIALVILLLGAVVVWALGRSQVTDSTDDRRSDTGADRATATGTVLPSEPSRTQATAAVTATAVQVTSPDEGAATSSSATQPATGRSSETTSSPGTRRSPHSKVSAQPTDTTTATATNVRPTATPTVTASTDIFPN